MRVDLRGFREPELSWFDIRAEVAVLPPPYTSLTQFLARRGLNVQAVDWKNKLELTNMEGDPDGIVSTRVLGNMNDEWGVFLEVNDKGP